jgi:hypothetical protein
MVSRRCDVDRIATYRRCTRERVNLFTTFSVLIKFIAVKMDTWYTLRCHPALPARARPQVLAQRQLALQGQQRWNLAPHRTRIISILIAMWHPKLWSLPPSQIPT